MNSITQVIPKKKKVGGPLVPALTLTKEKTEEQDGKKSNNYVSMEVKTRTNAGEGIPKIRRYIKIFEDGTPRDWLETMQAIKEIFTMNSVNGAHDQKGTITQVLRGDPLTVFEAAVEEAEQLNAEVVDRALNAVTVSVFPHRALLTQKLWMRRVMRKPVDMSTRQMAAAVSRINNYLPMFPGATEADKFSATELVELLEYAIPQAWRNKFDLDGYIPTEHDKSRLIAECERIERHEGETNVKPKNNSKKQGDKKTVPVKASAPKEHYCSHHGNNKTHNSADCFVLKNRAKNPGSKDAAPSPNKTFTRKNFRKEINAMSKTTPKRKLLEMLHSTVVAEQKKLDRATNKKSRKTTKEDSDSDTDMSCEVIDIEEKQEVISPEDSEDPLEDENLDAYSAERLAKLGQAPEDKTN